MKETKVYIGRRNGKHAELMQRLDKALKEQHFAFVFTKQQLRTHDRELVKEVCEKIKEFENSKSNSIADENGWFNSIRKGMTLNEFLDQIQKEYEE